MVTRQGTLLRIRLEGAPLVLCAISALLITLLCGLFRVTRRGLEPLLQPLWIGDSGWLESRTEAYQSVDAVQWSTVHTIGAIVFGVSLAAALVAAVAFCTLLLTRYSARRTELATRAALGAAPGTLLRELIRPIVRSVVAGGLPGLLLGLGAIALLRASWPAAITGTLTEALLSAVLGGSAGLALLALTTAVVLWWFVVRGNLADVLRAGDRATAPLSEVRLREALTCIQIAVSILLLAVGTALAGTPAGNAVPVTNAADNRELLVTAATLDAYSDRPLNERVSHLEQIIAAAALPVASAESIASAGALLGVGLQDRLYSECDVCLYSIGPVPTTLVTIPMHSVGPRFFTIQGAQLVRGRDFNSGDRVGSQPVVIVNDSFVRALFGPRGSGLGRVVRLQLGAGEAHRIVGVVPDQRGSGAGAPPPGKPVVYFSALQHPPARFDLIARARSPVNAANQSRETTTLAELRGAAEAPMLKAGLSVRALALLTFLLASLGISATTSALVRERRRDLAIRAALGSTRPMLRRYVAGYALRIAVAGALPGLLGAWTAHRLLQTVLPDAPLRSATLALTVSLLILMTIIGATRPSLSQSGIEDRIAIRG